MNRNAKQYLDLGIRLVKEQDMENAATAFAAAIKLRPDYAPAYNNLGWALRHTNQLREAEACYCRAIELAPDDWSAYNNLGLLSIEFGDFGKAETCFRRSLGLNPKHPVIYNNLGTVLEELLRITEAEEAYHQALRLKPNYPEAHYNIGIFLKSTARLAEAESCLLQAVALRPAYVEAQFALSTLYLLRGEFKTGWEKYEKFRYKKQSCRQWGISYWQGEELTGRSILLYWEYGFGDSIQFARYVQWVARFTPRIGLVVQAPLVRFFENAYPDVKIYARQWLQQEHYDYVCSLMSLPAIFNTDHQMIPPVVPYTRNPVAIETTDVWRKALKQAGGVCYKVGIAWACSQNKYSKASKRSIPFNLFCSLLAVPNISWVNLQVGVRAADLAESTYQVIDFSPALTDFMDTASLIDCLDLVITVDTAVAHLAGTIGKKTWVLLPLACDWRWRQAGEDSDWYPSVRLFRQGKARDWQEVLVSVSAALQEEVPLKTENFI